MTRGGRILKSDLPHNHCQNNAEEEISIAIQSLLHLLTLQCTAAGEMRKPSASVTSLLRTVRPRMSLLRSIPHLTHLCVGHLLTALSSLVDDSGAGQVEDGSGRCGGPIRGQIGRHIAHVGQRRHPPQQGPGPQGGLNLRSRIMRHRPDVSSALKSLPRMLTSVPKLVSLPLTVRPTPAAGGWGCRPGPTAAP